MGLDNTIVNVALPTIARGLSASVSGLQWIVNGYTMVLASLVMLAGATATGSAPPGLPGRIDGVHGQFGTVSGGA